ncbi:hypothetical protein ACEK06_15310 [Pseudomonas brenneri]|uniref:hypothetical protein n=1 Tax=Pseudomonas brenneri TaxID=129817 RepID=UPI0035709732
MINTNSAKAPLHITQHQPPIDPSPSPQHKRDTTPLSTPTDNTRTGGDSALAALYGQALLSTTGVPSRDNEIMIENIPPHSTFGLWWAQLGRAMQSSNVVEWMRSMSIDTRSVKINPESGLISYKLQHHISPDPQMHHRGPDDMRWSAVSSPVMAAAKVITAGHSSASFQPPLSETGNSAPLWLVRRFYKEQENLSPAAAHQRATELARDKTFTALPTKHFPDLHEMRSEDALDGQKAITGNNNTRHSAALEFQQLVKLLESGDVVAPLIQDHLQKHKMQVDPNSTHAKEHINKWGEISLKQYLLDNGWDIPTNSQEVQNLAAALLNPEPKSPPLGNYGGALTWPIPLDATSQQQLKAELRQSKFGDIDLKPFKSVLEYLMQGSALEPAEPYNPHQVFDRLIHSPKGQALGQAIQARFEAISVKGSANDWLLAALSIDQGDPVPAKGGAAKDYIAGYPLTGPESFGRTAPEIFKGMVNHLFTTGQSSSPQMAAVQANLLLASRAPEYLVENIPDKLTFGSHSWVSFVTAVGRLEAKAPGSTVTMSYSEIMLQAAIAPISAKERHIEYVAQRDALKHWGVANGLPYPETDAQMDTVRKSFNAQISELKTAFEIQSTPVPDARAMALEQLKKGSPDMDPKFFDEKCITLRPSHRDYPGPYSILDLYMDGRGLINTPDADLHAKTARGSSIRITSTRWVSSSKDVNISEVLKYARKLPHVASTFREAFLAYTKTMEKGIATQVKHLIAQQPAAIRNAFEFGKITVVREDNIDYTPYSLTSKVRDRDNNNLLIKTELNGSIRTYELDLKQGRMIERTDFGDFQPGKFPLNHTHPKKNLVEVTPTGPYTPGLTAERPKTLGITDSFNSERTSYIANSFVQDINVRALEASALGATTFDTEFPFYKKLNEFMLNLVPLRSAIINFQKGNIGEGILDLSLDVFGFVAGVGAAAKSARAISAGTSVFGKLLNGVKIVGRAAVGSLNPLSGFDDLARLAKQGLVATKNGFTQLYKGLTKVNLVSLAKKPSIAEGTLKAVNGVDDIKVFAKLDETTGNWHAIDLQTRKPYGKPLENFQPKVLSSDELQGNIEGLYKTLDDDAELDICYATALRTAQADKKITDRTFRSIIPEVLNGGTPRYNELMNVKPDTLKDAFNTSDITESGIITFVSKKGYNEGKITHAIYIQKTSNGELYLYHSNSHALDSHLGGLTTQPARAGKANVYKLGSEQHAGIQKFMGSGPGYNMVFTPASTLNARVATLAK